MWLGGVVKGFFPFAPRKPCIGDFEGLRGANRGPRGRWWTVIAAAEGRGGGDAQPHDPCQTCWPGKASGTGRAVRRRRPGATRRAYAPADPVSGQ